MQAVTSRMLVCLALLCLAVVKGQDIILLGDSLSDNGNGYAGTTKFVLQTNEVSFSTQMSLCMANTTKIYNIKRRLIVMMLQLQHHSDRVQTLLDSLQLLWPVSQRNAFACTIKRDNTGYHTANVSLQEGQGQHA